MPDVTSLAATHEHVFHLDEDATLDILYSARTGSISDLKEDLQAHSERHSFSASQILQSARDPHTDNTAAHYAAANGHVAVLSYIQEVEKDERLAIDGTATDSVSSPRSLFSSLNKQGSTPLHYAAVNGQLAAVERLLAHPDWAEEEEKKKAFAIARNHAGRTARDEADLQGLGREEWLKVVGLLERYESEGREEPEAPEDVEEEEVAATTQDEVEQAREGVGGVSME